LNEDIAHFISFHLFILVVHEPRIPRKANIITVLAKNSWSEDKGNFNCRGGRKTQDNKSDENPHNQVGSENRIHLMHGAGFEPRTPEVKGEERLTPPT